MLQIFVKIDVFGTVIVLIYFITISDKSSAGCDQPNNLKLAMKITKMN